MFNPACKPEGSLTKRKRLHKEAYELIKVWPELTGELAWSDKNYELFRYTEPGILLIFYLHTTARTQNQSLRVRDSNSKNTVRAYELMKLLDNKYHVAGLHRAKSLLSAMSTNYFWCAAKSQFTPKCAGCGMCERGRQ